MAADQERATIAERERRDHLLQEIIDSMTQEPRAWTAEEAAVVLERRIAHDGLAPMPQPWVLAVATGVARGEAYVVSRHTREDLDVPAPRHTERPYGID